MAEEVPLVHVHTTAPATGVATTTTAPVTQPAATVHTHPVTHTHPVAGTVEKRGTSIHLLKSIIAFLLMAFAVILFGLMAYQAHEVVAAGQNSTDSTGPTETEDDSSPGWARVGLNSAGFVMLFFGLIFAVLQAVTAFTMWRHIYLSHQHVEHSTVSSLLKVTLAIGFLAMGLACRHINLGVPDGADEEHVRITHAIEAFLIINWFFVFVFSILTLLNVVNWDWIDYQHEQLTRKHALSLLQLLSALLLVALFAAIFQKLTSGEYQDAHQVGLHGHQGRFLMFFGTLFAVLQLMTGFTMYQQCMRQAPLQNYETVSSLLKITLAFGLLAFGFACRHIYLGTPERAYRDTFALVIAMESFVIINFFITLFCHLTACHYDWCSLPDEKTYSRSPVPFALLQTILAIILIGLLAAAMQRYTDRGAHPLEVGLNSAGMWMMGFGLIFAVFEAIAGIAMIENMVKKLKGATVTTVIVTNKVAEAIGFLAMGFACRHIYLGMTRGLGDDNDGDNYPDDGDFSLIHAIEAFLIINCFVTWAIQSCSSRVAW